jgi:putative addiction module component (TIGR02574 family)
MIKKFDDIMDSALKLSAAERKRLAQQLLESLDDNEQQEIEAAWAEEIARRVKDFESGKSKPIPAQDVFREIRQKLRK